MVQRPYYQNFEFPIQGVPRGFTNAISHEISYKTLRDFNLF